MLEIDFWQLFLGILKGMWVLWPLWVSLLVIAAVKIILNLLDVEIKNLLTRRRFQKGAQWRSDQDLIRWLRGMRPSEFEEYIADLFGRLGYKTQATGGSHDEGIDVIAEKDGIKHYIQCKKYFAKHEIGSPDIREFWGAIAHQLGNGEGWFITTNKFTPEAEKFAEDKPIVLINQFKLVEYIHLAEKAGLDSKSQPETDLKCPQCGGILLERKSEFGKFYGCSNYPKCQYTENIKK